MKGSIMKYLSVMMIATAFVFSSGFFKKGEDGSYSVDSAAVEKTTADAKAMASAEADKLAEKAEATKEEMIAKAKKAAEKYNVKEEEVLGDLGKSKEELKAKVANMDTAKLVAYLSKYKDVFSGTEGKIADYKEQVKNLKWTQKYSAKGKELKASAKKYTDQYNSLKTQASVYVDKLESYGVDLSAYGIDLSKYGL